jgi:hypothetical protein
MDNLDEIQIRHRFEAVQAILLKLVDELEMTQRLISTRVGYVVADTDEQAHSSFFHGLRYQISELVP